MASPKLEKLARHPGIYKRGGSYVVVFRDPNGRQRKRFARTLTEATSLKAALRTDIDRGEYRQESRLTFAEYAAGWIDAYHGRTSRGIRPQTIKSYRADLTHEAIPALGRLRLTEIEARHLKAYAAGLFKRGLSANTARLKLAPVKCLLADAHEEGLIRSNPAAGIRLVQPARAHEEAAGEDVKALTEEELRKLLAKLPDQWRLLFTFTAQTGLRIGEVLGLQWKHVQGQRVLVRRRWYRGTYAPPKSRYGRRDVPITPELSQALWTLRKTSRGCDEDLVFASRNGTPLNSANVYNRVYKPAAEKAGVPWATFHTLRHTCATLLFRAGLNPKQVQAWLGHHSASFTLDTYVHLLADDLPEAPFSGSVWATKGQQDDARQAEMPAEAAVAESRG